MRLRYGYFITCHDVVKDADGEVVELHCTYDPETRGGNAPDGRKVRGTIHWVSAAHAVDGEVRQYDHLFDKPDPSQVERARAGATTSTPTRSRCWRAASSSPRWPQAKPGDRFQFERKGYFCVDTRNSTEGRPVFNRTVTLRDTWAKIQKKKG